MNKLLSATVGLATLGWVGAVRAAPMLFVQVFEDNVRVDTLSANSSTGVLTANGVTPSFVITASATGGFTADDPTFTTQQTSISGRAGASFATPVTLRFEFSQTGIKAGSAGGLAAQFASTFTANFLANSQFVQSVTLTNYVADSDAAFARTTMLASRTYTNGPTQDSGAIVAGASLTGLFSETSVIEAVFTGATARLQTSTQLVAVPEPASLALFGSALLGLGIVHRNRRKEA